MTTRFFQLKQLLTTLLLVAAMAMPTMVWAAITPSKPTGGDGSSSNPYQISTAAQLYWFAGLVNGTLTDGTAKNAAACAKLTANITVNSNVLKSDGTINSSKQSSFTAWTPIGYYNSASDNVLYTGTFDGNGKTISGLYFNNTGICFIGLFGYNGGTVKNVGIVDSYFKGYQDVGGVCGQNYEGIIFNCYYQGTIVGDDIAGGICGYNSLSTIVNCYCSGSVSVTGSNANFVGGVCGFSIYAVIENCYYNMDKCSEDVNGYYNFAESRSTMGKTTSQFQSGEVAYLLSEGRIIKDTTMTNIYDEKYILKGGVYDGSEWGQTLGTDNYPVLGGKEVFYDNINCQTSEEGYSNSSTPHNYNNGFCTRCDDYQPAEYVDENHHPELLPEYRDYYAIENAGQLYWFANRVNNDKYNSIDAVLTDHITVNSGVIDNNGELASNTSGFRKWTPIGWWTETGSVKYNGIIDGNNHQITGLYFNDENADNVGLLGYTVGTVRNLGIIGSYFKGGNNVGAMYGYGIARVINCFSFNCQVHGNTCVGGMCGRSYGEVSILCNSYMAGTVSGTTSVGSMCGLCEQESAIVANCYYDKEKCSIGAIGGSDVAGKAEGKTLAEFQSGKIAYLLSQGCTVGGVDYEGSNWGQWLKLLDYPTLGNLKVYYGYDTCDESAEKKYSNKSVTETRPNHSFDTNGFCTVCTSGYQPADLASNTHHKELVETHNGYYAIENAGQLYWFAKQVNGGQTSYNAVLTANITVNSGVLKSDGTVNSAKAGSFTAWTPIGNDPKIYTGTFDGNGKTVSGLYLDNASMNYMGLFGYSNGTVKNVGVVDSYFHGRDYVGGVCGLNYGKILLCHSKSYLHGANSAVGGVCGANNSGSMTNSYNTGVVTGITNVGGVCGYNYASISNCHNIGSVSGTNYVGSVCGQNGKTISNCYYDNERSTAKGINGADVTGQAEGKTIAQFQSGEVAYLLQGEQGETVWGQKIGTEDYPLLGGEKVNHGYPINSCLMVYTNLAVTLTPTHPFDSNGFCTLCGDYQPAEQVNYYHHPELFDTHNGYYAIENGGQLYWLAKQVNEIKVKSIDAVLAADITINSNVLKTDGTLSDEANNFRVWTPIGYYNSAEDNNAYHGTFDGNGRVISGLYFNDSRKDHVGLFGYVDFRILNVGIVDSYFNANEYVGGICGASAYAFFLNSFSSATVVGKSYVGGISGSNSYGFVNCYNTGAVKGTEYVGSILGVGPSDVINCYYLVGSVSDEYVDKYVTGKTSDQFQSGEVAYLLSQYTKVIDGKPYPGSNWGQQLGVDKRPVWLSDYKVVRAAQDGTNDTYWATFSNLNSNAELMVPTGDITVYNATVSSGKMTLTPRSDNRVAKGEGVLLKTDGEYVNAKNIGDDLTAATAEETNLVATPSEAQTITADAGYKLYRLTYNNVSSKEGLGFYLGVIKDEAGKVTSSDGSQLKVTPGKAYLKVASSETANARGFAFMEDEDDATGIRCVTVTDEASQGNAGNADDSMYDLGGRKVSNPAKGLYIRNGKKVIIK